MNEPTKRPMIYKEARECADQINANLTNVRQLVVDLHDREGWSALGYANWTECVHAEFKQAERYIFYQYKAAEIEQNVSDCTIVQLGKIPEGQLRPLSKIKDPIQQREAWRQAVETAPEGKVTAAHVYKIVRGMAQIDVNVSQKEPRKIEVTEAMGISTFIICHLERIREDDPKKEKALLRVERWIQKNITGSESFRQSPTKDLVSEDFQQAFDQMVIEIKNTRAMKWKTTSHKAAVEMMQILLNIAEH